MNSSTLGVDKEQLQAVILAVLIYRSALFYEAIPPFVICKYFAQAISFIYGNSFWFYKDGVAFF